MPNSISTTSNTQTNSTPATFKAGDAVLCPSLSSSPFVLMNDQYGKRDILAVIHDDSYHYYDTQGYFVRPSDIASSDYQPSLFHDTPANRQAIATLYHGASATQSSQPNKEVAILSSAQLSNMAFDIEYAAEALDDIGQTLALIYSDKVGKSTAKSLARLAHSSADTWAEILDDTLQRINKALALTGSKEVANHG